MYEHLTDENGNVPIEALTAQQLRDAFERGGFVYLDTDEDIAAAVRGDLDAD